MKPAKILKNLIPLVIALAVILTASAYAESGSGSYDSDADPLVTLSYINGPFFTTVREYVNTQISTLLGDTIRYEAYKALDSRITADEVSDILTRLNALEVSVSEITALNTEYKNRLDSVSALVDTMKVSIDDLANAEPGEVDFSGVLGKISELEGQLDTIKEEIDGTGYTGYVRVTLTAGQRLTGNPSCEVILITGRAFAFSDSASEGLGDVTSGLELLEGEALARNHLILISGGSGRGINASSDEVYILVKGGYSIVGIQS